MHPGELRGNIVRAAHDAGYGATASAPRKGSVDAGHGGHGHDGHAHGSHDDEEPAAEHSAHEGSMNMKGVFLHVLGDAVSYRMDESTCL